MPLQKSVRPLRATALRIQLPPPHSKEIVVQPYSLGQGAACLALDPAPDAAPESKRDKLARLAEQARILLGPEHAYLVDLLTVDQCVEIIQGLYLTGSGIDPANFVEVQKHRRKQRENERSSAELHAQIETLTIELAADLKRLPSEVEAMPLTDAVSLRERLAEQALAAARFDASLHGMKLQ